MWFFLLQEYHLSPNYQFNIELYRKKNKNNNEDDDDDDEDDLISWF